MSKNKVIIVLLIMLFVGVISLYTTFAYEENVRVVEETDSDYHLIQSLNDSSSMEVVIGVNEEKFIDINLENTYNSIVKYGIYYYLVNPNKMPDDVSIGLAEHSQDKLEDIIKIGDSKTISLFIKNESNYSVNLVVGALIGFENGNVEDLLSDGEVLVK